MIYFIISILGLVVLATAVLLVKGGKPSAEDTTSSN